MALRTKTRQEKLRSAAEDALSNVQPVAESALETLAAATEQVVSTVAATAGPALKDAKEKIGPAMEEARDKITPLAQQALAEGKARGHDAAVKLGVVEEPKKSHKLRNLLIVLGLAGVAAFVYKKVTGKEADPAWTASRDTAATRPPMHAAGPVDGSDAAPTAPLPSEEKVESPTPTTPDKPLTQKQV